MLRVICYAVMTCPRNNPHLLWPISLSMRELLASLAVNFVKGYIRYSVNSCIRQVLYHDPCICTGQMNTRCNMHARSSTSGSTEIRSKTHIRLNTVEQCVRTPGLSLLSVQQIRRDHRAKMGGNHCLSTALVLLTLTGRQNKRYVVFAILKHDPLPYFSQRAA